MILIICCVIHKITITPSLHFNSNKCIAFFLFNKFISIKNGDPFPDHRFLFI